MANTSLSADSTELFPAAECFRQQAERLKLLAPIPELVHVRTALEKHLPQRVKRFLPRLADPDNPEQWLSLILKTNFLIRLWNANDKPVVVGLNVSGSHKAAKEQLNMIQSPEFSASRRELNITKHYFVIIPGYPPVVPLPDELLDALYDQLELGEECSIISFRGNSLSFVSADNP